MTTSKSLRNIVHWTLVNRCLLQFKHQAPIRSSHRYRSSVSCLGKYQWECYQTLKSTIDVLFLWINPWMLNIAGDITDDQYGPYPPWCPWLNQQSVSTHWFLCGWIIEKLLLFVTCLQWNKIWCWCMLISQGNAKKWRVSLLSFFQIINDYNQLKGHQQNSGPKVIRQFFPFLWICSPLSTTFPQGQQLSRGPIQNFGRPDTCHPLTRISFGKDPLLWVLWNPHSYCPISVQSCCWHRQRRGGPTFLATFDPLPAKVQPWPGQTLQGRSCPPRGEDWVGAANTEEEENRATAQKQAESTNHSAEIVKCDFYDHPMLYT